MGDHCLSLQLQIWDTAGQERFRSITQSYYRSANALILVYDVCSQQSYESLLHWVHEIELYAGQKVLTFLVGKLFMYTCIYEMKDLGLGNRQEEEERLGVRLGRAGQRGVQACRKSQRWQ
jgi:hypothetical protein